ncbi:MAG: arylsulfatase [Pirellulaceae bacterium]|nr:arylsulfatase [Pirellulaceae bacterium]
MRASFVLQRAVVLPSVTACIIALCVAAAAQGPAKRPNILIVLADDMGFSDAGCYGGEIRTPNLDRLAAGGLRFTRFYNTARCWPTRSAIMTGYYPQQIRMDPPRGRLPGWASLAPHHLRPLGYRCYHVGKWHVTGAPKPVADGGFDRSYWFEDWDRYFSPAKHFEDDVQLPPVAPDTGYYATTAFAERAIGYLQDHAQQHAQQPFFLYLAFISPHFPLHAPREDIARYRDRYLEGWDVIRQRRWQRLRDLGIVDCDLAALDAKLQPRYLKPDVLDEVGPGEINRAIAWDDLTDEQQRFQATKMAIHAALVDRMDREIGRVLDQLRAMKAHEDTVIFFLSDNGADATLLVRGAGHDQAAEPGSWRSFLCLGPGWASAANSPFRRHKVWVHEGGISTPLIVHWPAGISARGELRHDMGHVIDLLPTILELAGGRVPEPRDGLIVPPLPGRSLVPALARDGAVERELLYFHHEGNRALRMGDWKLVSAREDQDAWELFDLGTDRCEMKNLAAQQPDRVREMETRWKELDAEFRRLAESPPK